MTHNLPMMHKLGGELSDLVLAAIRNKEVEIRGALKLRVPYTSYGKLEGRPDQLRAWDAVGVRPWSTLEYCGLSVVGEELQFKSIETYSDAGRIIVKTDWLTWHIALEGNVVWFYLDRRKPKFSWCTPLGSTLLFSEGSREYIEGYLKQNTPPPDSLKGIELPQPAEYTGDKLFTYYPGGKYSYDYRVSFERGVSTVKFNLQGWI